MNAERQKILDELWAEGRRLIIKDGEKEVDGTCNVCGVKGKYIADADDDGEWICLKCVDEGWETPSDSEEEVDVDDRDAPNTYPYKKCSECGDRKSCGNYKENDWFCEDCYEEDDCVDDNDRSYGPRGAPADGEEEEEGEWRNDVGWKCQKCDEWFEYCEVKESAEWGTICHECDEAPKPVVLCADCGDAIPDTENLDKCWTNDGETFWCEGCRESHVEEYIGERDGDD